MVKAMKKDIWRRKVTIRQCVDEVNAWRISDQKAKSFGLSPFAKSEMSISHINILGEHEYYSFYYQAKDGLRIGFLTVVVISCLELLEKDKQTRLLTINND